MKHWGKFLSWAGSPVKYKSDEIEYLLLREKQLKKEILKIQSEIELAELEFEKMIKEDWSNEEILQAKEKAKINAEAMKDSSS